MIPYSRKFANLGSCIAFLAVSAGCGPAQTSATPPMTTKVACATCQRYITATPPPIPTATPLPPPSETPTPAPSPTIVPVTYKIHQCRSYTPGPRWDNPWWNNVKPVYTTWCVLNLKVNSTGTIMLDVYWSARTAGEHINVNVPPEGPAIVYLMDNFGNKYDWTKRGGCALENMSVKSGEGCSGWFVYPPFQQGVTSVSFYYDAWHLAITDVPLIE
jgi:hypothetical protein